MDATPILTDVESITNHSKLVPHRAPNIIDIETITNHDELVAHRAQNKGGRPKGSTDVNKRVTCDAIIAAKNEIAIKYSKAKEKTGRKKVPNKTSQNIIEDVKQERKLPEGVMIPRDTIRRRISRKNLFVTQSGASTPLACVEIILVTIVVQMARVRQFLTPSKGLFLVNYLISGKEVQKDLID